jgi:uncharacterized membrane protein YedE/YeeE
MDATDIVRTAFTPLSALLGGGMNGAAAVALLLATGRIAGISGIAARLLPPYQDGGWAGRAAFVAGIIGAPLVVSLLTGAPPAMHVAAGPVVLVVAGLLVGFGTVWGNGCTSGHGVCGLSRLSPRSLVATLVFMATAFATVFVVRHVS